MNADNIIADRRLWTSLKPHPYDAVMSCLAYIAERVGWAGSWGCFLDLLLAYLERITHADADERWIAAGARFEHDSRVHESFRVAFLSLVEHFHIQRGFCDVLGPVHQEVSSRGARAAMGQFFTPWGLCMLNAEMQMTMDAPLRPDGGRWSVCDPAVGSGALLLAARAVFARRFGWENLDLLEVAGQDIDLTATKACKAQLYMTSPNRMMFLLATDGLKSCDAMRAVETAKLLAKVSMMVSFEQVEQPRSGQMRLL